MALDSAGKREFAISHPLLRTLLPDGTIDTQDRMWLSNWYLATADTPQLWSGLGALSKHAYSYKTYDFWTPPLRKAPRWMSFNLYQDLADYPEQANGTHTLDTTSSIASPSSSYLPTDWIGSSSTPTSGSNFQKFFEIFTEGVEAIYRNQDTILKQGLKVFSLGEPVYLWKVEIEDRIDTVRQRLTDLSYRTILKANSEYDLFNGGDWNWWLYADTLYLAGFDLIESVTESISGWHYVQDQVKWDNSNSLFLEHPSSKVWINYSPEEVGSDGFIGLYAPSVSGCRVRSRHSAAASALDTVIVEINGKEYTATRINVWNSLDNHGLLNGNERRDGENNSTYANSHLYLNWFSGQTRRSFLSYLSAALRTAQFTTLSSSASTFTLPASSTGFALRDLPERYYLRETLVADPAATNLYKTRFTDPQLGTGFLNNVRTAITNVSGNVFTTGVDSNNRFDNLNVDWKFTIWTQTSSTVTLNSVVQKVVQEELDVLYCFDVDLPITENSVLKKSFSRSYPLKKWRVQSLTSSDTKVATLTTFDT